MILRFILTIGFCFQFVGCLQTENSSSLDGAPPDGSPEFLAASEVFLNKCSGCHDYHTLSETEFVSLGLAIPGDPENSEVYYRIIGSSGPNGTKNMPSVGSISAPEVAIISNWITGIP